MALLAQTNSIRGFRDCEYDLALFLILLTVLVVFTFAGDRIARLWKEKISSNLLKMKPARFCRVGGNNSAGDRPQKEVNANRERGANAGKASKKKVRFRAPRI